MTSPICEGFSWIVRRNCSKKEGIHKKLDGVSNLANNVDSNQRKTKFCNILRNRRVWWFWPIPRDKDEWFQTFSVDCDVKKQIMWGLKVQELKGTLPYAPCIEYLPTLSPKITQLCRFLYTSTMVRIWDDCRNVVKPSPAIFFREVRQLGRKTQVPLAAKLIRGHDQSEIWQIKPSFLQLWPEIPGISTYNPIYRIYNPIYNQYNW